MRFVQGISIFPAKFGVCRSRPVWLSIFLSVSSHLVQTITSHQFFRSGYASRLLSMSQGYVKTLNQCVQSQCTRSQNPCVGQPSWVWILQTIVFHNQRVCSRTQGCIMTLTQGHLAKDSFTVHSNFFVRAITPSQWDMMWSKQCNVQTLFCGLRKTRRSS